MQASTFSESKYKILVVCMIKAVVNGPGQLTKMATISIYGKKPLKIIFETKRLLVPKRRFLKIISCSSSSRFDQMMILC